MIRILRFGEFLLFYLREVVLSNLRVAHDVLAPRLRARPAIIDVPLGPGLTDRQAYVLACLLTMTPGTLTLDVSPDKRTLTLHVMYAADPAGVIAEIQQRYERRVRDVF